MSSSLIDDVPSGGVRHDDGPPPRVLALLVVDRPGGRRAAELLAALTAQERRPDAVVAVLPTADRENRELCEAAGVPVVVRGGEVALDAAVRAALAGAAARVLEGRPASRQWLWVLPPDARPAPDALARLLAARAQVEDVGLVSPAVVDAAAPDRLLDVGGTLDRTAHVVAAAVPGELDQGQHDGGPDRLVRPVLGGLLRRDVAEALPGSGLVADDAAPLVGAVVAVRGLRAVLVPGARLPRPAVTRRARPAHEHRRGRRRAAALALLSTGSWPTTALRALVLGLVPSLVALLLAVGRRWQRALDAVAVVAVVADVPSWVSTRRAVRRGRVRGGPRRVSGLLAGRTRRLRERLARAGERVAGPGEQVSRPTGASLGETGPSTGDDDVLVPGAVAGEPRLRRPAAWAAALVAAVVLVAARTLLDGRGPLVGGRLLGVDADGAAGLLRAARTSTDADGTAGELVPAAGAAPLGLLAAVAPGAGEAVTAAVLVLGPVVAAAVAVRVVAPLTTSAPLRLWVGVAWGLGPPVVAAALGGDLGLLVALVVLPVALRVGAEVLLRPPPQAGWWRCCVLALLLTGVLVTAPGLAGLLAVTLLVAVAARALLGGGDGRRCAVAGVAALLGAAACALPQVLGLVFTDTSPLLVGLPTATAGAAGALDAADRWRPALLDGPGVGPPVAVGALLLAVAALALARPARRAPQVLWLVLLGALGVGVLLSGVRTTVGGATDVPADPAPALALATAAALGAAAAGGADLGGRRLRRALGGHHVAVALVALLAVAAPVLSGGWLVVRGADEPLRREVGQVVPEFVQARLDGGGRLLRLVVRDGQVVADLGPASRATYPGRLAEQRPGTGEAVAAAVAGRPEAADALAAAGVAYVSVVVDDAAADDGADGAVVDDAAADDAAADGAAAGGAAVGGDATADVVAALDTADGLVREPAGDDDLLWALEDPGSVLSVVGDAEQRVPLEVARQEDRLVAQVPAGPGDGDRVLVVAGASGGGWTAELDGVPLAPADLPEDGTPGDGTGGAVDDAGAVAFALGDGGGQVVVEHAGPGVALLVQLASLVVVALGALPGPRPEQR